ncbi:MAG: RecX family transcriptional regulator [Planctomycetota bacterium]
MTSPAEEARHAKAIALRLLRVTDRSRAALIDRLVERDVAPATAEIVVEALERGRLVDDLRLARETVDRELSRGPTGRGRLEIKLASIGVPDDIAGGVLDEAFDGRDPDPDAEAFARTKLRAFPPRLDPGARARRLAAALARRGFDEDTAARVVLRLVPDATLDPSETSTE